VLQGLSKGDITDDSSLSMRFFGPSTELVKVARCLGNKTLHKRGVSCEAQCDAREITAEDYFLVSNPTR
jgi:hypothetical protein